MTYQAFLLSLFCCFWTYSMDYDKGSENHKTLENSAILAKELEQSVASYRKYNMPFDFQYLAIQIEDVRQSPLSDQELTKAMKLNYQQRQKVKQIWRKQEYGDEEGPVRKKRRTR